MKFPAQQQKIYDALKDGGDVNIDLIYTRLFDRDPPKDAQQRIGPYIVKLNRRLAEHRMAVKPGRMKRTYTLQQL